MIVDVRLIKEIRDSRNWTQQHLADVCAVSLRTIQRIEKTGVASKESVASLLAAFDLESSTSIVVEDAYQGKAIVGQLRSTLNIIYPFSVIVFASVLFFSGLFGLTNSELDSRDWLLITCVISGASLFTMSLIRASVDG